MLFAKFIDLVFLSVSVGSNKLYKATIEFLTQAQVFNTKHVSLGYQLVSTMILLYFLVLPPFNVA